MNKNYRLCNPLINENHGEVAARSYTAENKCLVTQVKINYKYCCTTSI